MHMCPNEAVAARVQTPPRWTRWDPAGGQDVEALGLVHDALAERVEVRGVLERLREEVGEVVVGADERHLA